MHRPIEAAHDESGDVTARFAVQACRLENRQYAAVALAERSCIHWQPARLQRTGMLAGGLAQCAMEQC